jgi:hypothetical protein
MWVFVVTYDTGNEYVVAFCLNVEFGCDGPNVVGVRDQRFCRDLP